MSAQGKPLNFLPKSELERTTWGRGLKWALSGGRYIIILTEMVVIIAFLSRFKLDQELSDLGERINGKKNVLEAQTATEAKFRQVQDKINLAKEVKNGEMKKEGIFSALEADIPPGVRPQNLKIEKNVITFSAQASSEADLTEFLRRGSLDAKWREMELSSITAGIQQGVDFIMKLWL
ncbi:hypothetical protein HYS82_01755 [Candidatus Amesbacteria bacterium]|nr:hypothetical protein [Candidatus Amesbacteria bacterium]MBI2587375.1 hypothetical protein [Candidatus Amesbacteria bacterium]